MLRRRVMLSAALVAAGVGLVSVPAQAAGPSGKDVRAVTAPKADPLKLKAAAQTFTSPADRTVRKPLAAAQGKAQGDAQGKADAAPRAGAADGNPDLRVALNAKSETAHGLDLETVVTSAAGPLSVTVEWGDGTKDTAEASGGGTLNHSHRYAELGDYTVKVTVTDAARGVQAVNELSMRTIGSDFTPHAPTRLLDTRNGTGAAKAKVRGRAGVNLKVAGAAEIPAEATAVALNVTVTNTIAAGHITAHAGRTAPPATSNLNYEAHLTHSNLVIVPIGSDGTVELTNSGWDAVDLVADVTGYFTRSAADGYSALGPERIVDTRAGLGPQKRTVPGYGSFDVRVAGSGKVPAGATAVALNVTATNQKAPGHLTVFPSGSPTPSTSSVNFMAATTTANAVIVPVGADGKISIRNGSWMDADVVVDVVGYYSKDSKASYLPLPRPYRMFDTRTTHRDPGPVPPRSYAWLPLSFGAKGFEAFVLNTTVTNTSSGGFLSVAPDPNSWDQYAEGNAVQPPQPLSSTLNWMGGRTVPNLVQAAAGEHGVVDFWNQSPDSVDLVVDVFGYYDTK
ncbi:PKD domain-containing protein [Streptomyces sp. NPDC059851]|uniref:PKD domain-containing protein n=1 Tax=Streptomyces sp. NPDC059851 TaxID=3346971 RepID=UPI003654C7FA